MIWNERLKLLSNYLNGLAIAIFAVGGIAPVFSILYDGAQPDGFTVTLALICLGVSVVLHIVGQTILGRLR